MPNGFQPGPIDASVLQNIPVNYEGQPVASQSTGFQPPVVKSGEYTPETQTHPGMRTTPSFYSPELEGKMGERDTILANRDGIVDRIANDIYNSVYTTTKNYEIPYGASAIATQGQMGDIMYLEGSRDEVMEELRGIVTTAVETGNFATIPGMIKDSSIGTLTLIEMGGGAPYMEGINTAVNYGENLYNESVEDVTALDTEIDTMMGDPQHYQEDPSLYSEVLGEYRDAGGPAPFIAPYEPTEYTQEFFGADTPETYEATAPQLGAPPTIDPSQLDMAGIDPYLALAAESRGAQVEGLDMMRQAALGKVPSAAEIQMQIGLDEATKRQMALANAARGGAGATMLAQRQAAIQGAAIQQAGVRQASMLRAQEQAQAREAFGAGARQLSLTDREMTELSQIRAEYDAGNIQEARRLEAEYQSKYDLSQAEMQGKFELFNKGAQNYAEIVGSGYKQESGQFGEQVRGDLTREDAAREERRRVANLDSILRKQGLDDATRMARLQALTGMNAEQLNALISGEGMELQWESGARDIEARETYQEKEHDFQREQSEKGFMDYLGDVTGVISDPLGMAIEWFKDDKPTSSPTYTSGGSSTATPTTTTPTTTTPTYTA